MKYYVHNKELFDVIYKVHLSIEHGGWNRMKHEVNIKYKNITRDMIMLYLNSCESCKRKGSTVKKELMVQSIISTQMNWSII
jgi:hypothetical protein